MTVERQARIELLLCQEYAAEGHKVEKDGDAFVARFIAVVDGGKLQKVNINLTRLAELIDRRLS